MTIHQLAIFWRDQQARLFTSLHFKSTDYQNAITCAKRMVAVFDELSSLQIYGAALDDLPLKIEHSKPAPPSGTQQRLEIKLFPSERINTRAGITWIKFSIPDPSDKVKYFVSRLDLENPIWQSLEQKVIPYICLLSGIPVSQNEGFSRVSRIQLLDLPEDKRPQPGLPPVDAAITATERHLDSMVKQYRERLSKGEEPTPKDLERISKQKEHLTWLCRLQTIEKGFSDSDAGHIEHKQDSYSSAGATKSVRPVQASAALAPSANTTNLQKSPLPIAQIEAPEASDVTTSQPELAQTIVQAALIALGGHSTEDSKQEAAMPDKDHRKVKTSSTKKEKPKERKEESTKIERAEVPAIDDLLPVPPDENNLDIWKDIPKELFLDPHYWFGRERLKSHYDLTDRSYFRWVEALKEHGLARHLPAQQDKHMKLFYLPDVEQAIEQASAAGAINKRRGRPSKLQPQLAMLSPATSGRLALDPGSLTSRSSSTNAASQPIAAPELAQLKAEITIAVSHLQKEQKILREQNQAFQSAISQIQESLASFNHQLCSLANKQDKLADKLRDSIPAKTVLELIASFSNINPTLNRLSNRVNKLSRIVDTSGKPNQTTKMSKDSKSITPILLSTKEAAARLGLSQRRVQVLIKAGKLLATRSNLGWHIDEKNLIAFRKKPTR